MNALKFATAAALLAAVILFCTGAGRADAVRRVDTEEKVVALTFDDGPHPTLTAEILDILGEYGAKATFFVIGKNASLYPDALRMAVSHGHEIGNHTFSHGNVASMNAEAAAQEILLAENEILSVSGALTRLVRPPGGCVTVALTDAAKKLGYKVVLWSVDTRDWAHRNTAGIVSDIKEKVVPGSIVLFHDYVSGATHTSDALRIALPYLKAAGYSFVTVSELIKMKN